ncbi:MAG: cysteine--tRNA ligase [Gemmataceae bacterium]
MPLVVYNTLTRKKEEFRPIVPGKVSMYVCGPTVYKPSHVGHMVGPVIFDTVKRYLAYLGYEVNYVVNITDVDDKLIKQAALEKIPVTDLAERVTKDYVGNLHRLGVTSIDHMPRVSQFMPEIVATIQKLIDRGFAYPAAGDVYFDISRDEDYGKLCNRDPEQMAAGARIEVSEKKRNPGDFALWKGAKPGEPAWDSPWGKGRPGWHIECTAMSMKLLGATLDIHGGGLDLTFPHHENELAQSESVSGQPFVRYWMHNGLMRIRSQSSKIKDGVPGEAEKMSKSLGNEIIVSELFKRHEPETLRLLLLGTHYRSPIEYSEERLQELRRSLDGFYRFFERYERITGESAYALTVPNRYAPFEVTNGDLPREVNRLRDTFLVAMNDDFNTGGAVGVLFELLTTLNRFGDLRQLESGGTPADRAEFRRGVIVLRELGAILGLFVEPPRVQKLGGDDRVVAGLMQLLIDLRNTLRSEAKKITDKADPTRKMLFDQTDVIRNRLAEIGVTLEDRQGGTSWRIG